MAEIGELVFAKKKVGIASGYVKNPMRYRHISLHNYVNVVFHGLQFTDGRFVCFVLNWWNWFWQRCNHRLCSHRHSTFDISAAQATKAA